MDEPTAGMDPINRRTLWNVITNAVTEKKQCSVLLTTHSMDEAEALCTKLTIMVQGQFKCFGSVQHLKQKYGKGFEIDVQALEPTQG